MTREVLGLGPFLSSLEWQLDELSAEQLRRVLLEHGARLPASERMGFLHVFDTPGADEASGLMAAAGPGPLGAPRASRRGGCAVPAGRWQRCERRRALTAGVSAGRAYFYGLHDRNPRHVSFRKELRSVAAESPLL